MSAADVVAVLGAKLDLGDGEFAVITLYGMVFERKAAAGQGAAHAAFERDDVLVYLHPLEPCRGVVLAVLLF